MSCKAAALEFNFDRLRALVAHRRDKVENAIQQRARRTVSNQFERSCVHLPGPLAGYARFVTGLFDGTTAPPVPSQNTADHFAVPRAGNSVQQQRKFVLQETAARGSLGAIQRRHGDGRNSHAGLSKCCAAAFGAEIPRRHAPCYERLRKSVKVWITAFKSLDSNEW